jgi:hypothetical protein
MNFTEPTGEMLLNSAYNNSGIMDNLKVGLDKAAAGPKKVGIQQIREAFSRLEKFRSGKSELDARIKREEE